MNNGTDVITQLLREARPREWVQLGGFEFEFVVPTRMEMFQHNDAARQVVRQPDGQTVERFSTHEYMWAILGHVCDWRAVQVRHLALDAKRQASTTEVPYAPAMLRRLLANRIALANDLLQAIKEATEAHARALEDDLGNSEPS